MNTKKLTKLLALYLPYVLLGLVATNIGEAWRLAEGKELGDKIMAMMGTLPVAFANPLPSLHPLDLIIGLSCGAGLRLAVYLRSKNAKKYRHGMEYGSARWGNAKDIEPFQAPKFADNIILTKTERLMMSNRPPDPKNARNKNVLVVGGSGSGKTRFWLKPNLLQCHSSYVVTDPKGTIVLECGQAMLKNGYRVKILNTINFKKSMHYNPFSYVHSEKDILKLVTTLMTNTKGEGSGGDPFWEKSERLLLTALIAYLHYEAPVEEQNFATLLEMLNTMQVLEDDEEYQNPVDLLFEDLGQKKPTSFAVRQYKLYKLAAGKTAKSILISCGARLAPFDIQELRDLTMYDELELDTLGDKKTALFLIMSDTDSTFNFLISMVYTQLFNLLCDKADDVYGGKLPIHVRCLIDEAANIGQIPNLEKLVATIRSREISACLVLQARSQLKAIYKDNADTIVGNMDSQIFLGGSEPSTLKELSEMLGKETIDSFKRKAKMQGKKNTRTTKATPQEPTAAQNAGDSGISEGGSNWLSRWKQRQEIRKGYYATARSGSTAAQTAGGKKATSGGTAAVQSGVEQVVDKGKSAVSAAVNGLMTAAKSNAHTLVIVGVFLLLLLLVMSGFSSCSIIFSGTTQVGGQTIYTAEDRDIRGAEEDYKKLEKELEKKIQRTPQEHPGYDEYQYHLDPIEHDPWQLTSFLSTLYDDYTRSEVQGKLQEIFKKQYKLTTCKNALSELQPLYSSAQILL